MRWTAAGTAGRVIYSADPGSPPTDGAQRAGSRFGSPRLRDDGALQGGCSIADLAAEVAADLGAGRSVALCVEAPLTVPVPPNGVNLCPGRQGEGSRSFAAPAGLAVTALGLQQSAWVLAAVLSALGGGAARVRFAHRPADWPGPGDVLFCWEAFVSRPAHSNDHVRDVATAVVAFAAAERNPGATTSVRPERPLSLIAAAALWSGWLTDPFELHAETAMIRPAFPCAGNISVRDSVQP